MCINGTQWNSTKFLHLYENVCLFLLHIQKQKHSRLFVKRTLRTESSELCEKGEKDEIMQINRIGMENEKENKTTTKPDRFLWQSLWKCIFYKLNMNTNTNTNICIYLYTLTVLYIHFPKMFFFFSRLTVQFRIYHFTWLFSFFLLLLEKSFVQSYFLGLLCSSVSLLIS